MKLLPIGMDWDGSLAAQPGLCRQLVEVVSLLAEGQDLRIHADSGSLMTLMHRLTRLRIQHPQNWLTFLGSGDYHHLSLLLLETMPQSQRPSVLVVVDNHPDWFMETPRYHCGNWVGTALKTLPWLKRVVLVGGDSGDWCGMRYLRAPWDDLCDGRVTVIPYRRESVFVPFRQNTEVRGVASARQTGWGVELAFNPLTQQGVAKTFQDIARSLEGEQVYLSIDKDCLRHDQIVTDWDQGELEADELVEGVRFLAEHVRLCGADICGEVSPRTLEGWMKRLDTGRVFRRRPEGLAEDHLRQHEALNLRLMDALEPGIKGVRP